MRKRINFYDYLNSVDIPILAFLGVAIGVFMFGIGICTVGTLVEWDISYFIKGMLFMLISAGILAFTYLYWKFVPKKYGVVCPKYTGFGIIIGVIAIYSSFEIMWCIM